MPKPDYDTSIARMAGNIAAGLVTLRPSEVPFPLNRKHISEYAVELARDIVAEVKRTTPQSLAGLTENRGIVVENGPASARSIDG